MKESWLFSISCVFNGHPWIFCGERRSENQWEGDRGMNELLPNETSGLLSGSVCHWLSCKQHVFLLALSTPTTSLPRANINWSASPISCYDFIVSLVGAKPLSCSWHSWCRNGRPFRGFEPIYLLSDFNLSINFDAMACLYCCQIRVVVCRGVPIKYL